MDLFPPGGLMPGHVLRAGLGLGMMHVEIFVRKALGFISSSSLLKARCLSVQDARTWDLRSLMPLSELLISALAEHSGMTTNNA